MEIRRPGLGDVEEIARVHVDTWREAYRGLMPDSVLDDPALFDQRVQMWTQILGEPAESGMRPAVAVSGGRIVGIALARVLQVATRERDAQPGPPVCHLFVLYVYERFHGTGAGEQLLKAVTRADEHTTLMVADPNPRAQAFYAKHGFEFDGHVEHTDITERRMVRSPR